MENRAFYWLASLLIPLILLSSCTKAKILVPADNGASVTPSNVTSINGVVQLDRVRNANVKAYSLSPNGQIGTEVLGEATTNEKGEFQMSLPNGTGPIVLRSSGGKYDNEADGVETDASELSNIIDPSQKTEAPLTPMTTLAKDRTLSLVEGGTDLETAQASAKQQVAQVFGLSAEALDKLPAASNEVDATTDPDSMKSALALATLSEFMKAHFPNKTIEEVMAALVADFTTDGSINGDNQAGDLQNVFAQLLAYKWHTEKGASLAAAKLNPRLGFKSIDFNQVAGMSFEEQAPLHKVYQDEVYYLGGVKTSLPESGTGVWNGIFYSAGEMGSGFFEGSCYLNGADTLAIISGKGFCTANSSYYIDGEAFPDLSETGTGFSVSKQHYFIGGIQTSLDSSGSGVWNQKYFVNGEESVLGSFSDFSVDLQGGISAITTVGSTVYISFEDANGSVAAKMVEADPAVYIFSASVVRSRNGEYTVGLVAGYHNDTYLNYAAMVVYDSEGIELKRFRPDADAFHTDTWITMDISDSGRIAIVYQADGYNSQDQRLRLIDASGSFDTGPISFASYGECNFAPKVALNRLNNNGVVTCQNHAGGPIYFRLFNVNGEFTTDLTLVTYQTSWYDSHALAMNDDDQFAVISTACSGPSTQAYFYDFEGNQVSVSTLFNDDNCRFDTTRQNRVNVHVDSSGNFYLPWLNPGGDWGTTSSAVSKFSPQGQLLEEFIHAGSEKFNQDNSGNRYYLVGGNIEIVPLGN